jgi:hypothetical protein
MLHTFIETTDGSFVLSSEVTEIRKVGKKRCSIATKSGDHYSVSASASNLAIDIERRSVIVIAAHAGYFMLYATPPVTADGDWQAFRVSVVGWSVIETPDDGGSCFDSLPILASVNFGTDIWALLRPDGIVDMPYVGKFDSVEDWLLSLKKPDVAEGFCRSLSRNRKRVRRCEIAKEANGASRAFPNAKS